MQEELATPPALVDVLVQRGRLMGAWDHFYPDAAFSATVPTHYVNLLHWICLDLEELAALNLPVGDQHSERRWMPLDEATTQVHRWVQPYVDSRVRHQTR